MLPIKGSSKHRYSGKRGGVALNRYFCGPSLEQKNLILRYLDPVPSVSLLALPNTVVSFVIYCYTVNGAGAAMCV